MSKRMQKILRKAYSRVLGVLCNPYHLFYLIIIKILGVFPQNIILIIIMVIVTLKQEIYLEKLITL